MTVDPTTDELVSAYLDGEVTEAERAVVEGDPVLLHRVATLRRVSAQVREPKAGGDAALHAALARLAAEGPARSNRRPPRVAWRLASVAAGIAIAIGGLTVVVAQGGSDEGDSTAASGGASTTESANRSDQLADAQPEGQSKRGAAEASAAPATSRAASTTASAAAPATPVALSLGTLADDADLRRALIAPGGPVGTATGGPIDFAGCSAARAATYTATVGGRAVAVVTVDAGRYRVIDLATCTSRDLA